MTMSLFLKIVLVVVFLLFGGYNYAQKSTVSQTPKVGLVLSGGSARGLAHIGVLKKIDSLGIKIDYIGGTSMGAIIGSLYAAGYSGKRIDSIFKTNNLSNIIFKKIPRRYKGFTDKRNEDTYALTLPFKKLKLSVPLSIGKNQEFYHIMSRLLIHLDSINDFQKMPIPFYCIATNLETGRRKVFDKGVLIKSIIASASLPSILKPVSISDSIYIDGGISDNFPVKEMQERDVDIIIGVDIPQKLSKRDEIDSGTDLLAQVLSYSQNSKIEQQKKLVNVLITPDVADISLLNFDNPSKVIEKGSEASELVIPQLLKIKSQQGKQTTNTPISPKIRDSIEVNKVIFSKQKLVTEKYLRYSLNIKNGEKISFKMLNRGISNLSATNQFEEISYQIKPSEDGERKNIFVDLKEKKIKTFLKFGVHYDGLYKTAGLINYTKNSILFRGDLLSADLILGDNSRYLFSYRVNRVLFWNNIAFLSQYNTYTTSILSSIDNVQQASLVYLGRVALNSKSFKNQILLESYIRGISYLSLGLEHQYLSLDTNSLIGIIERIRDKYVYEQYNLFGAVANFKVETLDDKYFPTKGFYLDVKGNYYLEASGNINAFNPYLMVAIDVKKVFPITKKIRTKLEGQLGASIDPPKENYLRYRLGGYGFQTYNNVVPMYGYDPLEVEGNNFIKAGVEVDYQFFKKNHLNVGMSAFNIGSQIIDNETLFRDNILTAGYGIDTILGPIEIKYTYSLKKQKNILYFNLGFWF